LQKQKTFYLNPSTRDLEFNSQNSIIMVDGSEEELQTVRLLLSTNAKEWFLNILHGLAYEHILVKSPSETRIRAELLRALEQEERIAEVLNVSIDLNRPGRYLTIGFEARMASGQVIADEVVV